MSIDQLSEEAAGKRTITLACHFNVTQKLASQSTDQQFVTQQSRGSKIK